MHHEIFLRARSTGIVRAAEGTGLALTPEQARALAMAEERCCSDYGRVSFGPGVTPRLVRELAWSPQLAGPDATRLIQGLVEGFYALRDERPATVTDQEIAEALARAFDGEAAGDAGLACEIAGQALGTDVSQPYVITDDEGRVYRFDGRAWEEDLLADGWYGERWEDVDE